MIVATMRISILGAGIDSGNYGIRALTKGTLTLLAKLYPSSNITLYTFGGEHIERWYEKATIPTFTQVKLTKWKIAAFALFSILPHPVARTLCLRLLPDMQPLVASDLVFDLSEGESFTGIYGYKRFLQHTLVKFGCINLKMKIILLPQTIGPFNGVAQKCIARYILKKSYRVFLRDRWSADYLSRELDFTAITLLPDMGVLMEPKKPGNYSLPAEGRPLVGVNVSGLLWRGGYTRNNMFGLRIDYKEVITKLVKALVRRGASVLLVPHVFSSGNLEDDASACMELMAELGELGSITCLPRLTEDEVKYCIGQCEFFVGSRMHSCIAAVSQNVPILAISYSPKFAGTLGELGLEFGVVDASAHDAEEVIEKALTLFTQRETVRRRLEEITPTFKSKLLKGIEKELQGIEAYNH